MRLIAVSVGTILIALLGSACTDEDSGSTGIVCNSSANPPLCFANSDTCGSSSINAIPGEGRSTSPIPTTFNLTVASAEGPSLCGTPGTQATITIESGNGDYSSQTPQRGDATLTNVSCCDCDVIVDTNYAYRAQSYGQQPFVVFDPVFRVYNYVTPGNKSTLTLGPTSNPDITAQFCYETLSSGSYKMTTPDGSIQEGTWSN